MSGCDVTQSSEKLTFTIHHMNRQYQITCETETDAAEWMAALILSANAKLPTEICVLNNNNIQKNTIENHPTFNDKNIKNYLKIPSSQKTTHC